jgi:hypothetical protein
MVGSDPAVDLESEDDIFDTIARDLGVGIPQKSTDHLAKKAPYSTMDYFKQPPPYKVIGAPDPYGTGVKHMLTRTSEETGQPLSPGFPTPEIPGIREAIPDYDEKMRPVLSTPPSLRESMVAEGMTKEDYIMMVFIARVGKMDKGPGTASMRVDEAGPNAEDREVGEALWVERGGLLRDQLDLEAESRGLTKGDVVMGPYGEMTAPEGAPEHVVSAIHSVVATMFAPYLPLSERTQIAMQQGKRAEVPGWKLWLGMDAYRTGWGGTLPGISRTLNRELPAAILDYATDLVSGADAIDRIAAEVSPSNPGQKAALAAGKLREAASDIDNTPWAVKAIMPIMSKWIAKGEKGDPLDGIGVAAFEHWGSSLAAADWGKIKEATISEVANAPLLVGDLVYAVYKAGEYWGSTATVEEKISKTGNVLSQLGHHLADRYGELVSSPGTLLEKGAFKAFFDIALLYQIPAAAARLVARAAMRRVAAQADLMGVEVMVEDAAGVSKQILAANAEKQAAVDASIIHLEEMAANSKASMSQLMEIDLKLTEWRVAKYTKGLEKARGISRPGETSIAFDPAKGVGSFAEIVDQDIIRYMRSAYKVQDPASRAKMLSIARDAQAVRDFTQVRKMVARVDDLAENLRQTRVSIAEAASESENLTRLANVTKSAPKEMVPNPLLPKSALEDLKDYNFYVETAEILDDIAYFHLPVAGQAAAAWRGARVLMDGPGRFMNPLWWNKRVDRARMRKAFLDPENRMPVVEQAAMRQTQGDAQLYHHLLGEAVAKLHPSEYPTVQALMKFDADSRFARYLDYHPTAGRGESLYTLKKGFEITPEAQRTLDIANRYEDLARFTIKAHRAALDAMALSAPEKAFAYYFPEKYEIFWKDYKTRIAFYKEWVSTPNLESQLTELLALRQKLDGEIMGRSLMRNNMRKKFGLEERKAGQLFDDGSGAGLRLADSFPEEMAALSKHYYDMQMLKYYDIIGGDAASLTPFTKSKMFGISVEDALVAREAAKKSGSADELLRADKVVSKARAEARRASTVKQPASIEDAIANLQGAKTEVAFEEAKAALINMRKELSGQAESRVPIFYAETLPKRLANKADGGFIMDNQGNLVAIVNEKIHGTGVHRYGKLNGMLDIDIAYEWMGQYKLAKQYAGLGGVSLRFFKAAHTIMSVGTHATNWLGNILVLAPVAGIALWNPLNWKYYKQAIKDFGTSRARSVHFQRWVGSMGRGPGMAINKAELLSVTERGVSMMYRGVLGHGKQTYRNMAGFIKGGMNMDARMMGKAVGQELEHLFYLPGLTYQVADDFHRYVKFLKEIDNAGVFNVSKANILKHKKIDLEAAASGRRAFADYENLNGVFQAIRSNWAGQAFVAFDIRTVPVMADFAVKSAAKLQLLYALQEYLVQTNRKDAGYDSELLDGRLAGMPEYKKHQVFLSDHFPEIFTGKWKYLAMDTLKYMPAGRRLPLPGETGMEWFLRNVSGDMPAFGMMATAANFDPHFQRWIYDTFDSPELKAEKVLDHAIQMWTPSITFIGLGYREKRIEKAKRGVRVQGIPMDLTKERIGAYGGMLVDFWTPAKIEIIGGAGIRRGFFQYKKQYKSLYKAFVLDGKMTEDEYRRELLHLKKAFHRTMRDQGHLDKLIGWFEENESELLNQERELIDILEQQGYDKMSGVEQQIADDIDKEFDQF